MLDCAAWALHYQRGDGGSPWSRPAMFPSSTADTRVALRNVLDLGTLSGLTEGQLLERYLKSRDERAFEIIVTRHARMVLGVCRRMLIDSNDVDDAFQATFLILVRKASTIRSRDRLSPWLYGVAYKVASRARAVSKARKSRESTNLEFDIPDCPSADSRSELFPLFDEELMRLPERYRAPVRLCCLEGKSHEDAARELAWPVGTVRSRLFRGRRLLQTRLTRRGVAPSLVMGQGLTTLLGPATPVEPSLIHATLETVSRFQNAKLIAATTLSSSVAMLTQGVLTTMFLTKLKIAASSLLLVSAVGSGAVLLAQDTVPRQPPERSAPLSPTIPQGKAGQRRVADVDGDVKATPTVQDRAVSSSELRARLNAALRKQKFATRLAQRGQMGKEEADQINDEVDILKAQIDDERETLANGLEVLKIRLRRMNAELQGLESVVGASRKTLARHKELYGQKAIGPAAIEQAEADVASSETQVALKKLDIQEVEIRISQLCRKLNKLSDPVATEPGTSPREIETSAPSQPLKPY
jgi:RNA polymerase sigma factor (sigma-70 family)